VSLLAGLSYPEKLGGIISISGGCARRADVSSWISDAGKGTPVLMCFGDGDPVISYSITQSRVSCFKKCLGHALLALDATRLVSRSYLTFGTRTCQLWMVLR